MCKRPGKWERERAREMEKGKGKEDIYYTGTLPAAAQSRKPGIQGGALAIFFCSFLKAKRVSVLCQKVDQHALKGKQEIQGGALAIFFFTFWSRNECLYSAEMSTKILCICGRF